MTRFMLAVLFSITVMAVAVGCVSRGGTYYAGGSPMTTIIPIAVALLLSIAPAPTIASPLTRMPRPITRLLPPGSDARPARGTPKYQESYPGWIHGCCRARSFGAHMRRPTRAGPRAWRPGGVFTWDSRFFDLSGGWRRGTDPYRRGGPQP